MSDAEIQALIPGKTAYIETRGSGTFNTDGTFVYHYRGTINGTYTIRDNSVCLKYPGRDFCSPITREGQQLYWYGGISGNKYKLTVL